MWHSSAQLGAFIGGCHLPEATGRIAHRTTDGPMCANVPVLRRRLLRSRWIDVARGKTFPLGPKLHWGPHLLEAPLRPQAKPRFPLPTAPAQSRVECARPCLRGDPRRQSGLVGGEAELRGYSVPSGAWDGVQMLVRSRLFRASCGGAQRFNRSDVQQRANAELGRDTLISLIDPDQDVSPRQPRHLGMANLIRLPARHHEPEWTEWSLR